MLFRSVLRWHREGYVLPYDIVKSWACHVKALSYLFILLIPLVVFVALMLPVPWAVFYYFENGFVWVVPGFVYSFVFLTMTLALCSVQGAAHFASVFVRCHRQRLQLILKLCAWETADDCFSDEDYKSRLIASLWKSICVRDLEEMSFVTELEKVSTEPILDQVLWALEFLKLRSTLIGPRM